MNCKMNVVSFAIYMTVITSFGSVSDACQLFKSYKNWHLASTFEPAEYADQEGKWFGELLSCSMVDSTQQ